MYIKALFPFFQEDGSIHHVHKLILASQSEFFEALFSFEDKKEYRLLSPDDPLLKKYFTGENLKLVLDTFYEIEADLEEEKTLEIIVLANYFLADFLMEKLIKNMLHQLDDRLSLPKRIGNKIKELIEFSKQWNADQLKEALEAWMQKNFSSWLSYPIFRQSYIL